MGFLSQLSLFSCSGWIFGNDMKDLKPSLGNGDETDVGAGVVLNGSCNFVFP